MLTHIVPKFEKGRILKTEMLENLRDYPRSFLDIRYQDFSDGIITGMNVTVGENTLTIGRGIVKHKDRLYLLEQEQEVPYAATGRLSVLKLLFLEQTDRPDFTAHHADIVLEDEAEIGLDKMELGRFKLKDGAVLRSDYQDFADMATEFNTWSDIHAPFAGLKQSTLRPETMRYFASELLKSGATDPMDCMFALICLNSEAVDRASIQHYIANRNGAEYRDYSHAQLHRQLVLILEGAGRGKRTAGRWQGGGAGRMIVD
ncbi:DNA and RNA helicase [Paenibacillus peoriae]|uniref:DNA and RNA helicase n=1 Tax=Paenibacillus peoriae TaxID=59893 RepID=UPI003F9E0857